MKVVSQGLGSFDDACDRGSSVVGLVVLAPVMLTLFFFVVAAGRIGVIEGRLTTAASGAARAATQHQSPFAAQAAALSIVESTLGDSGTRCEGGPKVFFPEVDLTPGGKVQVQVSCAVGLSDLTTLGVPGSLELSADAVSVVDNYRSEGNQP